MKVLVVHRNGQYKPATMASNRLPSIGDTVDFFEPPYPTVSMLLRIYHESTLDGLRELFVANDINDDELADIEIVIMVE